MTTTVHTSNSSYREMILEHIFVGELLRHLWKSKVYQVEVLKSQVDDSGYDLIIEVNSIVRHIQLKASFSGATTSRISANRKLASKPSGCIVWIIFDESDLRFDEFLWFGDSPGEPLPSLDNFPTGRHTKADSTGQKAARPNIRVIDRRYFTRLDNIAAVADILFGTKQYTE